MTSPRAHRPKRPRTLRGTALAGLHEGTPTPPQPYLTVREEGLLTTRRFGAPTWLWLAGGVAVVAGLLFIRRKDLVMAFDYSKGAVFKAVLRVKEPDAVPYADLILRLSQAEGVSPFITVALGKRESRWGKALRPDGTGDHTARTGSWLKIPGVRVVTEGELPTGWLRPKDANGIALPGPYAIPEDGGGWGRGIMQVDWPRARADRHDHRNVEANIRLGLRIYREKLRELVAPPSGSWTISAGLARVLKVAPGVYPAKAIPADLAPVAALAAYNAGAGAIRRAYSAAGWAGIDAVTTGGDYATNTSANITALRQAFDSQVAA